MSPSPKTVTINMGLTRLGIAEKLCRAVYRRYDEMDPFGHEDLGEALNEHARESIAIAASERIAIRKAEEECIDIIPNANNKGRPR